MQHYPGDDIGVFLAVCEAGSFAAASTRMGLSPSAIAKAVGRIENRLSVVLFKRTTRRLSLTAEGAAYREVCRSARSEIERVETTLSSLASEPAGTVHVSLPPLFGAQVIAPALYSLSETWPHLDFSISTSTERTDLFNAGIDFAVRIGDVPDLTGLVARRLGTQHIALCGSQDYFSVHSVPQTVKNLTDHRLIGTPQNKHAAAWQFRGENGEIFSYRPDTRLLLDGSLLTLSAIRGGFGIGVVPRWLVRDEIDGGQLVTVLDDVLTGHLPIYALWPASTVMLPRLRVTIDAVVTAVSARHLSAQHVSAYG